MFTILNTCFLATSLSLLFRESEPIFFIRHEKCIVRRSPAKTISRNMFLTNSQSSLELRDNIRKKKINTTRTLKHSSRTLAMSDASGHSTN